MTSFHIFLLILGFVIGWAGHIHWHRARLRRLFTPKPSSTWIDPQ